MTERQNFLLELYREFGDKAQNALDFVIANDGGSILRPQANADANANAGTIEVYDFKNPEVMLKEFYEIKARFLIINNHLIKKDVEDEFLDTQAEGLYTYLRNLRKRIGDINSVKLQDKPFEVVDLGLPSGRKWANMNLGATKPNETGLYLTHEDACNFKFEDGWKMPTDDDFVELCDNCEHEWKEIDGVYGQMFTSKINGNSVFFPASGYYNGTTLHSRGSHGYYWASTLSSSTYGRRLYFNASGVGPQDNGTRFYGFSVRPVQ